MNPITIGPSWLSISFSKLYVITLNELIFQILEDEGHRAMVQDNFYQEYQTTYHILVIKAIIDEPHYKFLKVFYFFVDFQKAFYIIPQHLLFERLQSVGISG